MDLSKKRVLVTGGAGFLGQHIVKELEKQGCLDIVVPRSFEYDLRRVGDVRLLLWAFTPDIIIHAAAHCGGIGLNKDKPAELFYDNAIMGIHLMEECRKNRVEKFVQLGTICSYPKMTPTPFKEEDLWNGYPDPSNAPYGVAKKALLTMGYAYRLQYNFNVIHLLIANLYGPNDKFDLRNGHVIPTLIMKVQNALDKGSEEISLWGSGQASRDFLYVEDAARDVVSATETYDGAEPFNLGTSKPIRILDLVHMIAQKMGYKGEIMFNTTMPDGQPRRYLATDRSKQILGDSNRLSLSKGLDRTIEWYRENLCGK
jgi:GDP-L-fucose synthase